MSSELSKTYEPSEIEEHIYAAWIEGGVFDADPSAPGVPYTIVIPPPNVTAPLHLGHALNNSLQDILIRFKRMQQNNTLWMPGTDHAGIATQTAVEKHIIATEDRRRTDFERDEFLERIVAWKEEFEAVRSKGADLLGASADEIALIHNTTEGMNLIAFSLDLEAGDEVIAAEEPNYRDISEKALAVLEQSHDLRVAVLLASAELRLNGFEGFAKVTTYIRGCLEEF